MDIEWVGRENAHSDDRERIDQELNDSLCKFDQLSGDELMAFAFKIDPDLGMEIMQAHGSGLPATYKELEHDFRDAHDNSIMYEVDDDGQPLPTAEELFEASPPEYDHALNEFINAEWIEVSDLISGVEDVDAYFNQNEVQDFEAEFLGEGVDETSLSVLRSEIMERRPDLQAFKDALQLDAETIRASNSWSPSKADADALAPPAASGRRQEASLQQSRRL